MNVDWLIQLRMVNGPELMLATLTDCSETHNLKLVCIQLGKTQQNGFVERFDGSFRKCFLHAYLHENIDQGIEM